MQTFNWYYNRLKAMSPGEIAWRMRSSLRDRIDKLLLSKRQRRREIGSYLNGKLQSNVCNFHVCDIAVGTKEGFNRKEDNQILQYKSLMVRAMNVTKHKLDFFDLKDVFLGNPTIWNRDHKLNIDTPIVFSPALDYRDINIVGDCKFVWEPNRHHQLVVLARAYRLSGDVKFAKAVTEQLDSWLNQNPYGLGIRDNLLFICDGTAGLKVYDKTDPVEIEHLSTFEEIFAKDVIPLNDVLLMIGDDVLYQYEYAENNIIHLSTLQL